MHQGKQTGAVLALSVMLLASTLVIGLTPSSFAAGIIGQEHMTNEEDETTEIGSIELVMRQMTRSADGTVEVRIMQGENEIASTSINVREIGRSSYTTLDAEFDELVEVEGDFDIIVEHFGNGRILLSQSSFDISSETSTSGNENEEEEEEGEPNNGGTGDGTGNEDTSIDSQDILDNVFARKSISQDDDEETTIESVEFIARKMTRSADGNLVVAIVQGADVLGSSQLDANDIPRSGYRDFTVDLDVDVTGDFEVVLSHTGDGRIAGNHIEVTQTSTSPEEGPDEEDPDDVEPNPTTPGMITLIVNAEDIDEPGSAVNGMFVMIWQDMSPIEIESPYTPLTIELEGGNEYMVSVADYDGIEFVEWKDGSDSRWKVSELTEDTTFTALYTVPGSDPESPPADPEDPPADDETETSGGPGSLTVNTRLLDGSASDGFQVQLRTSTGGIVETQFSPAMFEGLESGETYRAVMYSTGDTFFRHFSDGWLHRYHLVTGSDSAEVLTADYEHIPAGQQATLMISAQTTDGQSIGSTTGSELDETLQAEPGLEVQLAPPGTMTPYTAGFTGGSELPFTLVDGQTYVVIMTEFGPYQFSHWADNMSENSSRTFTMNGDQSVVAIYELVE